MKVLLIAPQPFFSERGTPMNVKLMCQVLGEAGHSIDLLTFPTGRNVRIENVNIIRLPNVLRSKFIPTGPSYQKMGYDLLLVWFSFLLAATRRYDVIHGIEEGGFLSVFLGRLFNRASVFDLDSCMSEQLKSSGFFRSPGLLRLVSRFEQWSYAHSSLVIAVCQALVDHVRSVSPGANISLIEDIPLDVHKESETCERMVDRLGLAGAKRVVYTGNLEPYQGIDLLLDAWEHLIASRVSDGEQYRLLIVGGSDEKVRRYRRQASAKGIGDTILWLGTRPAAEMGNWMEISHVLVSPRIHGENTPLKIYTYMSAERPIVATRSRTHTQVLDDATAFLADPSPPAFADALFSALNDTRSAGEKSERAKRVIEQHYTYDVFSRKLLDAYASSQAARTRSAHL